jgi:hypothetical protein
MACSRGDAKQFDGGPEIFGREVTGMRDRLQRCRRQSLRDGPEGDPPHGKVVGGGMQAVMESEVIDPGARQGVLESFPHIYVALFCLVTRYKIVNLP